MKKQTELCEIFALREFLLYKLNPTFYKKIAGNLHNSALAAQDWIRSGNYHRATTMSPLTPMGDLPGYKDLSKKYNLEFDFYPLGGVNPMLPYDLAQQYNADISANIIDAHGKIISPDKIQGSQVLLVYHNTPKNGMPADALKMFKSAQVALMKFKSSQQNNIQK